MLYISGAQGQHRGNWYFPNGTRLPFSEVVVSLSIVMLIELIYVTGTMLTHQLLVSIAVRFLSMTLLTSQ